MLRSRYRRIVFFFARMISSFIFWDLALPRIGLGAWARRTRPERLHRSASAFRMLAIEMGGVMIKVGQFLSSRVDVLPQEVTNELAGLQDEVPPVAFEDIRQLAELEFGKSLATEFEAFEQVPLAAASLGQVHRARLRPENLPFEDDDQAGFNVVVKIQRPHIETIIATDLAALRTVGNWLRRYRPISRRADVPALLEEFTSILYEEIDYLAEGRNAETFAVNFARQPQVRVPKVVWSHTTTRVLTLENVLAIKITDYDAITAAGVDRAEVASCLLETYLQQIFEDGFFHADPHPGNLFVRPCPCPGSDAAELDWQLTFVDFGMVGRVPDHVKAGLREMIIGVGTQDAHRVVHSYQMLGVLLPSADLEMIEKAEAKAFDRFWGKSMAELSEISFREAQEFAHEFRQLIYSMPFQVPQDMIFVARAVGILSGMCTGLDPQFNLWDHLVPFAEKIIAEEVRQSPEFWLNEAGELVRALIAVPRKIDHLLTKMDRGEISVQAPEIKHQVSQLERVLHQIVAALLFATLFLGGIQLYLADEITFAVPVFIISAVTLLWTLWQGRRTNR